MFRRSYQPKYDAEALEAIKSYDTRREYCYLHSLIRGDAMSYFTIVNTARYNMKRNTHWEGLHLTTFFEKEIDFPAIKAVMDNVFINDKFSITYQINGHSDRSVSNIEHLHIFIY